MKIYVAGPYTASTARDVQKNVDKAISVACKLIRKGHNPYIPHLTHYVWIHPDGDFGYETWLRLDREWLRLCDGFLYLASSKGADSELELAKSLGMTIFYDVDSVPEA